MLYTEIYEYLDQYVAGNTEAKKQLAVLGYTYVQRCIALTAGIQLQSLPRLNTMIVGHTGSGKSYMVNKLAQCLGMPFLRVDCGSLSQVGWEGVSIEQMLSKFTSQLDLHEPYGVIMLDEFDKLGHTVISSKGSAPNVGIQHNLLDLLDGVYKHRDVHSRINNCLVICAGAFSGATRNAKHEAKSIGFTNDIQVDTIEDWRTLAVGAGLMEEIVGRIVTIIKTERLNKEQIRTLILKKEGTAYQKYINLFGIQLKHYEVDELVDELYDSPYGVRSLETKMYEIVSRKFEDILEAKYNERKI